MGKEALEGIITVATAVVAVAIVAVLVSKNSSTGSVLASGGNALSAVITAAVSPVTSSAANNTELSQIGHLFPQ